jgi:hypothetical protein
MKKITVNPLSVFVLCILILINGTSCDQSKRISKNSSNVNRNADYIYNPEERFAKMTSEEIRDYEIQVMRKIADLALIPPKLNTSPLPEFDYDQLDYGMTIGIERTPKGRLWAAWVAGGVILRLLWWQQQVMITVKHGQNPVWLLTVSQKTYLCTEV